MSTKHWVNVLACTAAAAFSSEVGAQARFLERLEELRERVDSSGDQSGATAAPANLKFVAAEPASVLEHKFNLELGEPPIAVARDERCETVAAVNPADVVQNLFSDHKDQIVDLIKRRREDLDTEQQRDDLTTSARLEMKRQVWLPLAVEEQIGARILAQRETTVIAPDDPAAADVYPAADAMFQELRQGVAGLQPYDLRLVLIEDGTGIPNAETLPGGIVLMNLALAQAEPERVYAYLAHELGHVTKRHQTMALQAKLIDSAQGAEALSDLSGLTDNQLLDEVLEAVDLTAALFTRYYSAQELEADACGAKYLAGSPSVDGVISMEMFLEDVEGSEDAAPQDVASDDSLVKEVHPPYAERRNTMSSSFLYWRARP